MHSARVARRKLKRVLNPSMLETWQGAINVHIAVSSDSMFAMAITEEPILSSLTNNRAFCGSAVFTFALLSRKTFSFGPGYAFKMRYAYDHQMRELEELRGCNRSPKSSCPSTPSSGTLTSGGKVSFVDLSPKSLEKHCRPISIIMMETEVKGTLIERLDHVEERVMRLEDGFEADKHSEGKTEGRKHRKGLRWLVKNICKKHGAIACDRLQWCFLSCSSRPFYAKYDLNK
ncbi:hypothetical protein SADUNF_Sadunf16G0152900 [Salix dunnii]|uniref:Uncharacterized protein n=1 Tax=Salix dunnii TaxID=1413687 RepID=A0A835MJ63_9ROSI|nr:hypothetical protein SADUNF_Sadunf16G0152900 [Salix dunnii]